MWGTYSIKLRTSENLDNIKAKESKMLVLVENEIHTLVKGEMRATFQSGNFPERKYVLDQTVDGHTVLKNYTQ